MGEVGLRIFARWFTLILARLSGRSFSKTHKMDNQIDRREKE
jgi:hypothetical protein